MAVLNPGSSSVSAQTYESALLELLATYRANRIENSQSTIGLNFQNNGDSVLGSAELPIEVDVDDLGMVTTVVVDETSADYTWVGDATSDIKAPSLPAQIFFLANKIQSGTPLAQDIDRVTLTFNTDAKVANLNINFNLVPATGAAIAFNAADYVADFE